MIRQRAASSGPAVRGYADALPFGDGAFDAAMAILTIHHWSNWRGGVREMARVSQRRIVIFTWDPASEGFWLRDYLPELIEKDRERFPAPREIASVLGNLETHAVPIPHDCTDGFLGAYWRRPAAYLDPRIRAAISSLASVTATAGLNHLAADLADGTWMRKYHDVLQRETLDLGYRLCVFAAPA
jgi:SAM-dependent methyltransferase